MIHKRTNPRSCCCLKYVLSLCDYTCPTAMTLQSLREERPLWGTSTVEFPPCISPFQSKKTAREAKLGAAGMRNTPQLLLLKCSELLVLVLLCPAQGLGRPASSGIREMELQDLPVSNSVSGQSWHRGCSLPWAATDVTTLWLLAAHCLEQACSLQMCFSFPKQRDK